MINIGIIEKDFYRLQELKEYVISQQEFTCLFAAANEKDFLKLPASHNPFVVLLGINEEGSAKSAGYQIRTVQQKLPNSAIIVFSEVYRTNVVLDALRAGALGYLDSNTSFLQIKEVIFQVAAGGAFMSPAVARKITDYFRLKEQPELFALTNREKEIVTFLTEGFSYKMIALNLGLSLDTVRFHLRNIYKKLQVKSKAEVISKVLKQELLIRL